MTDGPVDYFTVVERLDAITIDTLAPSYITCPDCQWDMELLLASKEGCTEVTAVLQCTGPRSHRVRMVVHLVKLGAATDCGTIAGYKAHLRAGENACGACNDAHMLDDIFTGERVALERRGGK